MPPGAPRAATPPVPAAHVNAVGAPPRTGYREIDNDVVRLSRVVVDSLPVALAESGAIRGALDAGAIDPDHVSHDIGHVIAGIAPGRRDDQQITLYNSVGLAIQDLATARILVHIARRDGLGTDLPMSAPRATLTR